MINIFESQWSSFFLPEPLTSLWEIAHSGAPFLKCIVAVRILELPESHGGHLVGQPPSMCSHSLLFRCWTICAK